MNTSRIVIVLVSATALCAGTGCSSSSIDVLSKDGAAGSDAPAGSGGAGGGGIVGSGGAAGSGGIAGTGGKPATGGSPGSGGITAAGGSGGLGGTSSKGGSGGGGGTTAAGGTVGTGGATGGGGSDAGVARDGARDVAGPGGDGGTPKRDAAGTGGVAGAGGATGGGPGGAGGAGGTGKICGGSDHLTCSPGQLCDIVPGCGRSYTSPPVGICKLTGTDVVCSGEWAPVCGCDGKTYSNDCLRIMATVLKYYDGACSSADGGTVDIPCNYECLRGPTDGTGWYLGGQLVSEANCLGCVPICNNVGSKSEGCYSSCSGTGSGGLIAYANCGEQLSKYRDAFVSWQAPISTTGTGPAVVVSGAGWAMIWDSAIEMSPGSSPSTNPTITDKLTSTQIDDLIARLQAVANIASLPHAPLETYGCTGILYFQPCLECKPTTLKYSLPQSVSPEMEQVWSWFDLLPGISGLTTPRNYCARAGGDI